MKGLLIFLLFALAQGSMLLYIPPLRFIVSRPDVMPISVSSFELCANATTCISKTYSMPNALVILLNDVNTPWTWQFARATVSGKVLQCKNPMQ